MADFRVGIAGVYEIGDANRLAPSAIPYWDVSGNEPSPLSSMGEVLSCGVGIIPKLSAIELLLDKLKKCLCIMFKIFNYQNQAALKVVITSAFRSQQREVSYVDIF